MLLLLFIIVIVMKILNCFLISVEIERSKALQSLSESASSKIVVAPLDVLNHANGLLSQTPRQ